MGRLDREAADLCGAATDAAATHLVRARARVRVRVRG